MVIKSSLLMAATALSAHPTLSSATEMKCKLPMVAAVGEDRQADLTISYESEEEGEPATLTMEGTHRHPHWIDREEPMTRTFQGRFTRLSGEPAIPFTDGRTIGIFSKDYVGLSGLSLHVSTIDRMYFEQFVGRCEVQ